MEHLKTPQELNESSEKQTKLIITKTYGGEMLLIYQVTLKMSKKMVLMKLSCMKLLELWIMLLMKDKKGKGKFSNIFETERIKQYWL